MNRNDRELLRNLSLPVTTTTRDSTRSLNGTFGVFTTSKF